MDERWQHPSFRTEFERVESNTDAEHVDAGKPAL